MHRITVVDDSERMVASALREALDRNPHLVITCGGLGPALDDVTMAGVALGLERPLSMSQPARGMVEAAYRRLARQKRVSSAGMNLSREKMGRIPVGGTPLENLLGVAPGVATRLPGGAAVICLPGHPDEALPVLEAALEEIHDLFPRSHTARHEVEAPSPDESALRPLLERLLQEFPGLWISSRPLKNRREGPAVIVTFEATAPNEDDANSMVAAAVRRLLALASGGR